MNHFKTISIPFNGKGHEVTYKVETIDLSMTPIQFLNVYSVFIEDETLKKVVGSHFTILYNHTQTTKPCYDVDTANTEQANLKKTIAQQIINNPTE